jgi:hypothetical protein
MFEIAVNMVKAKLEKLCASSSARGLAKMQILKLLFKKCLKL